MVRIKGKDFSGNVFDQEENILTVVVYSDYSVRDIANFMLDATEVVCYTDDGNEIIYPVNHSVSCTQITNNVYSLKYSTKPTVEEELQNQIDAQSRTIDALMALVLEG